MATLSDELSKVVGRERVRVLALKLLRYANLALYVQGRRRASDAELRAEALASLLAGSDLPSNRRFLQFWVEEERAALWKTELRWASRGSERWLDRLQHCIRIIGGLSEETVAALEDDEGSRARQDAERMVDFAQVDHEDLPPMMKSMTEEECRIDPTFAARHWAGLGSEESTRGNLVAAVKYTRRAVALEPLEAEHHFFLGARLGQLGQVDEALSECWLATRLRPEWDRPRVEVGIILYNARRFVEAANHLEETERVLPAFPPNLGYVLGRTRLALADPAGALTALERTLELEPNHALALDAAAYCAFALGHPTKGPKYAKEANHLGQAATYEAWKRGAFRKRK